MASPATPASFTTTSSERFDERDADTPARKNYHSRPAIHAITLRERDTAWEKQRDPARNRTKPSPTSVDILTIHYTIVGGCRFQEFVQTAIFRSVMRGNRLPVKEGVGPGD